MHACSPCILLLLSPLQHLSDTSCLPSPMMCCAGAGALAPLTAAGGRATSAAHGRPSSSSGSPGSHEATAPGAAAAATLGNAGGGTAAELSLLRAELAVSDGEVEALLDQLSTQQRRTGAALRAGAADAALTSELNFLHEVRSGAQRVHARMCRSGLP